MVTPSSDRPGAMFGKTGDGGVSGVPAAEASCVGRRLAGTEESGADAIGREVARSCGRKTNTIREIPAPITIQRNSRSLCQAVGTEAVRRDIRQRTVATSLMPQRRSPQRG